MSQSLLDLLDRPIAYHRVFVTITGSVTAAVMLSQAFYWQKRCQREDGWWWKTAADWTEETGLVQEAQSTARKRLVALGFWQESRRGVPAKLWYHIDLVALENKIRTYSESGIGLTRNQGSDLLGISPIRNARDPETTAETTAETTPDEDVTGSARADAGKAEEGATGTAVPPGQAPPSAPPNSDLATPKKPASLAPAITEACGDWQARYDGAPPGDRIGKMLKPTLARVAKRLGCEPVEAWEREARVAWRAYLDGSEARFASPERFGQTYGSWSGTERHDGKASGGRDDRRYVPKPQAERDYSKGWD